MPAVSTVEHARLRRIAFTAIVVNVGIVFTGGVVRVTGSGLGCPDWPTCDGVRVAPTPGGDHAGWQAAIEFGNRLLTFVVLAAVVALFVQVRRTRPHPALVEPLAWLLPAGVLAQAVLGGVTVLTGLHPFTVAGHFLLSMVLIWAAVVLHDRVRMPAPGQPAATSTAAPVFIRHLASATLAVASIVLLLGTVVTGAGPHGGDAAAPRLGVDIRLAAIAHADAVWMLLGLIVALVVVTRRTGPAPLRRAATALLVVALAQGGVGYAQYALGIPPTLVSLHIVGAALVWTAASVAWVRARPQPSTT